MKIPMDSPENLPENLASTGFVIRMTTSLFGAYVSSVKDIRPFRVRQLNGTLIQLVSSRRAYTGLLPNSTKKIGSFLRK